MTDPRQELQRVISGEIKSSNILHLAKRSGYHLYRVKEIAEEMGLAFLGVPGTQDSYRAILPPVEGQGRIDA
jgi:gamma-glutamylcysteine synthetase